MEENNNSQHAVRVRRGVYEIPPLKVSETVPPAAAEEIKQETQAADVQTDTQPGSAAPAEPPVAETPVAVPANIADAYLAAAGAVPEEETPAQTDSADDIYTEEADVPDEPAAPRPHSNFIPATNPLKLAIEHGDVVIDEIPEEQRQFLDANHGREKPAHPQPRVSDPNKLFGVFEKGESPFVLIMSLVNIAISAIFTVMYIICVCCREILISEAVQRMAVSGIENYTVEVTSPLFSFLKILIFIVPVLLIAWTVGVMAAGSKKKALPDKFIVIGAYALDFVAGIVAILDVFALRIIFG